MWVGPDFIVGVLVGAFLLLLSAAVLAYFQKPKHRQKVIDALIAAESKGELLEAIRDNGTLVGSENDLALARLRTFLPQITWKEWISIQVSSQKGSNLYLESRRRLKNLPKAS